VKRIVAIITAIAVVAHAVVGCCWHSAPSACCGGNASIASAAANVKIPADCSAEHACCHHHDDGLSVADETPHDEGAEHEHSQLPTKFPAKHCNDTACQMVARQGDQVQIDVPALIALSAVSLQVAIDPASVGSHALFLDEPLWSPWDRTLAHQVLLI
jgi:hypothetical protein